MNEFGQLRKSIDEAITYGRFELAARLTQEGLRQARQQELLGEIEYFTGQAEILEGNYYEAIEHFDQAIKYNPHDGAAFNDRALCMVELGIINEAFYYFDKAQQDIENGESEEAVIEKWDELLTEKNAVLRDYFIDASKEYLECPDIAILANGYYNELAKLIIEKVKEPVRIVDHTFTPSSLELRSYVILSPYPYFTTLQ